jgi:hypothetical protein
LDRTHGKATEKIDLESDGKLDIKVIYANRKADSPK